MKRIRINNDFTFVWAIERNGLPEDLSTAINMVLRARNSRGVLQSITDYTVAGNMVSIEVTPDIANVLGKYNFILTYELPDASLDDLERLCEVDVDAFILVPRTAEADDSADFVVTSDMAIGFKGDSAYQVWLDAGNVGTEADFFAYLQQPAADMIANLNETNEAALTAEGLRATAEGIRLQNEQGRVTAESLRATAETARQTNTSTAIQNAENATALALEVAEHPDKIVADYWWKWNTATNEYENTNIMAKGGVYYPVFDLDPNTGLLTLTADSDYTNTTFEINETDGTLILNINM